MITQIIPMTINIGPIGIPIQPLNRRIGKKHRLHRKMEEKGPLTARIIAWLAVLRLEEVAEMLAEREVRQNRW
jgi:hypothetical protein